MNRKHLPLIIMLSAGAVTCVINMVRRYPLLSQMLILFGVLVLFYLLGSVLKWTLDYFEQQNSKKTSEEGEVIEKEAEQGAEQQTQENRQE